MMKNNNYLSDGEKINWKNIRKLVSYLSENENTYIKTEYTKRRKMRPPRGRPDENKILFELMSIPIKNRECEEYINPFERGWRTRYYKELFDVSITKDRCSEICMNYLEGLEWTMTYYTKGCKDWRWEYKYDYPPLLQDLIQFIPYFDTELIDNKYINPVNEYTQLAYVIPKPYFDLLPSKISNKLLATYPEWYSTDCKIRWAFCKYFWESHACLPLINLDQLENEINQLIS
jgi:5'-3' exonuclease